MSVPSWRQWRKWLLMMAGRSVQHVGQPVGSHWRKGHLKGYYNDLSRKVAATKLLDEFGVPLNRLANGRLIHFPIAVAQYGLGAFDSYIGTGRERYLQMAIRCADHLVKTQDRAGGWDVWGVSGARCRNVYSAMAQGEAISLLLRVGNATARDPYSEAARSAVNLLTTPTKGGGTLLVDGDDNVLEERVDDPASCILNGWIFAIFGLYDALLGFGNDSSVDSTLKQTVATLERRIHRYDTGYWSRYDQRNRLASPFYHRLHISLLLVCAELFSSSTLDGVAQRWLKFGSSRIATGRAFALKAYQKLCDPGDALIVE